MSRIDIGVIAKPHGVRGELRIHLYNSDSTALDVVPGVFLGDTFFEIVSARKVKGGALLRLAGIEDRNRAESVQGQVITVEREELELDEDDVLLDDFVGCTLLLEDGTAWGEIDSVIPGIQDLLVIHQGSIERYLPLVNEFILEVNLEERTVLVSPPEELPEWDI